MCVAHSRIHNSLTQPHLCEGDRGADLGHEVGGGLGLDEWGQPTSEVAADNLGPSWGHFFEADVVAGIASKGNKWSVGNVQFNFIF